MASRVDALYHTDLAADGIREVALQVVGCLRKALCK